MRGLKERLVEELNTGKLAWLLEEVKKDPALSLSFGVNTLELYYCGALAATVKPGGGYAFWLDENHFTTPEMKEEYAIFIRDKKAVAVYQRKFPVLLQALDIVAGNRGLQILFPQEIVNENTCVLDANYPLVEGVAVMLAVVKGKLLAIKEDVGNSALVSTTTAAFGAVNQGDLIESAKLAMANRVALGLMEAPLSFEDKVELVFLCRSDSKLSGVKTLSVADGCNDLSAGILS